ncbi:MAG: hypothetical protein WCI67_18525, partial [Chloroflexales bacterium]
YWTIAWDALVAERAHVAVRARLAHQVGPQRDAPADTDPRGRSPYRAEQHGSWQRMEGYTDSPDQATAERGQRYLAAIIPAVARALREFYQATPPAA